MQKIYPNFGRCLLPSYLLCCCCLQTHAQQWPQNRDTSRQNPAASTQSRATSRQISFIVHAPVVLPALLKQQQYEQMRNYLANWRNADFPSLELIFGAEALLAIQTGRFSSYSLPCDCLVSLEEYARELEDATSRGSGFGYYLQLRRQHPVPRYYDATQEARSTLLFLQSWARDLLARPGLKDDELFICRTLAGDIDDPHAALKTAPDSCPRITQLQRNNYSYDHRVYITNRNSHTATIAVMAGWWFPTGQLRQVLGSHPSVGLQLGTRSRNSEYDLSWNFRFGNPTPRTYTFMRHDSLFNSNYYDGGYIGFEYSRYLIHKERFDFGCISGIAYDYFSVANGWGNNPQLAHLEPFNVGSFDWNNGLRVKYFPGRLRYIGITAKYHLIHYNNKGGTDLTGNAFTVDLSYGIH